MVGQNMLCFVCWFPVAYFLKEVSLSKVQEDGLVFSGVNHCGILRYTANPKPNHKPKLDQSPVTFIKLRTLYLLLQNKSDLNVLI